jgi:hypothetical protein
MNDKLHRYALLAEIVGGISIVASLLFVGLQIKQSAVTVQAQTRLAMTEQARDNIKHSMEPMSLRIMVKLANGEELTQEEVRYSDMAMNLDLRGAENVFYQYRVGTFSKEEFEGYKSFYRQEFSGPRFREQWARRRNIFSKDFQDDVDALISESR